MLTPPSNIVNKSDRRKLSFSFSYSLVVWESENFWFIYSPLLEQKPILFIISHFSILSYLNISKINEFGSLWRISFRPTLIQNTFDSKLSNQKSCENSIKWAFSKGLKIPIIFVSASICICTWIVYPSIPVDRRLLDVVSMLIEHVLTLKRRCSNVDNILSNVLLFLDLFVLHTINWKPARDTAKRSFPFNETEKFSRTVR